MAKKEVSEEEVGAAIEGNSTVKTKRTISEDKGGGQINVWLASDEVQDKYVQLRVDGKTVDSQKAVNGHVLLRFPNGWPTGDFSYKIV